MISGSSSSSVPFDLPSLANTRHVRLVFGSETRIISSAGSRNRGSGISFGFAGSKSPLKLDSTANSTLFESKK